MLISEKCQPFCLKLLTVHTSRPAFCSVSFQFVSTQVWAEPDFKEVPSPSLCPQPHACSLSVWPGCSNCTAPWRASFTVQRWGDDWFYRISSLAGPRGVLLFKFHAHSGCVPPLLALGMHVSGGNAVFLSISLLWFKADFPIQLTQT